MAAAQYYGTGRRKTSTARVRITEGSGKLSVNGRDFENYFSHENFAKQAYAPLLTVDLREKIDVTANVAGGRARQAYGGAAGSVGQQIKGKAQELKGKAQQALGKARHRHDDDDAEDMEE